jgi:hypothetical protein
MLAVANGRTRTPLSPTKDAPGGIPTPDAFLTTEALASDLARDRFKFEG